MTTYADLDKALRAFVADKSYTKAKIKAGLSVISERALKLAADLENVSSYCAPGQRLSSSSIRFNRNTNTVSDVITKDTTSKLTSTPRTRISARKAKVK